MGRVCRASRAEIVAAYIKGGSCQKAAAICGASSAHVHKVVSHDAPEEIRPPLKNPTYADGLSRQEKQNQWRHETADHAATLSVAEQQVILKSRLSYDPDTGVWVWLVHQPNTRIGQIAGCERNGYRVISFLGRAHLAHRLAFLYMECRWPSNEVDHINRVRNDNRWCNLRDVDHAVNVRNVGPRRTNVLGVKGVTPLPYGRYRAEIKRNGVRVFDRTFATIEEAVAAYIAAGGIV